MVILFSCTPKESNYTKAESSSHSYSDSYKAPVFTHDDRIKKIAPKIQKLIADHAKAENIPGIAYGIVVDNKLVIDSATGYINLDRKIPATPSSSFRIASMTKSFTAMAIIKLKDEGKLALSDPVSKFIPEKQLALGYRWENEEWELEPMLHDGSFGAIGGLITSIEDFSKYVSFLLSAWPPRNDEDTGLVKRSSLREMQTPQFSNLYTNARDFNGDTCAIIYGYGYGLYIAEYCSGLKRVLHGGALPGFGSNYILFPEYGIHSNFF